MSYLVTITFDLKNGSRDDYKTAYDILGKLGLKTHVASGNQKPVVLPTTTCMGEFNGKDGITVRDYIVREVEKSFAAKGLTAEIFVTVGTDWAWQLKPIQASARLSPPTLLSRQW